MQPAIVVNYVHCRTEANLRTSRFTFTFREFTLRILREYTPRYTERTLRQTRPTHIIIDQAYYYTHLKRTKQTRLP